MRPKVSLTRTGVGVLVGAAVIAAVAWWWGYNEFIALGVAGIVMVGVGFLDSQRGLALRVRRTSDSIRIPRGDEVGIHYDIVNARRRRSATTVVFDRFQGTELNLAVPRITPGQHYQSALRFRTKRRGQHLVGPASLTRHDVFSLAVAELPIDSELSVLVHPRIFDLTGDTGMLPSLDEDSSHRRYTTDPQATFQSLREYEPGDDPRLIHWPTTARTGTMMVREFFEDRQPEFVIVLDTAAAAATADDFEEMVDVTASIAALGMRTGMAVVMRTTSRDHPGHARPLLDHAELLDLLTPVNQSAGYEGVSLAALFQKGVPPSIMIVTGPQGPSSKVAGGARLSVVRVGVGATVEGLQGRAIAADTAVDLADAWRRRS